MQFSPTIQPQIFSLIFSSTFSSQSAIKVVLLDQTAAVCGVGAHGLSRRPRGPSGDGDILYGRGSLQVGP